MGGDFLVAYELEDPKPRRYLLDLGQPGHCPPFPMVGDVMVVHAGHGGAHNMMAIKHVLAKNSQQPPMDNNYNILQENENLVGKVNGAT